MPTITLLKQNYIAYFEDVPVQKYAAMSIGRDEDTIIRWKKEDAQFADAIKRAHAEWIRKKVISVKAEFALERMQKDLFSVREEVVVEPMPTSITDPIVRADLKLAFRDFVLERARARSSTPH